MKLVHEDLQKALELLILECEKRTFLRYSHDDERQNKGSFTVGCVRIILASRKNENSSNHFLEFSIEIEGQAFCRGGIGYTPVLYSKKDQSTREDLLSNESIRAVITIHHSKNSYSQVALILFDKANPMTWFASCKNTNEAAFVLLGEPTKNVSIHFSEIVYPENLMPNFYDESQKIIEDALQNINTKCLSDLAEIIAGKSARSSDYCETGIPYLRARDVQNGTIVCTSVCLPQKMAMDFSRQLLQDGDILLTKHFGQRKLALVTEENLPAIASEALFIIRPYGVSEKYLYKYLTSNTGNAVFNAQLNRIEKGSVISSIALSDLKRIKVPVYDEQTMLDYEQSDALSGEERLEALLRIIRASSAKSESVMEKQVFNDLVSAGWDCNQLSFHGEVRSDNGNRWIPDLTYCLPDGTKAYFELKKQISKASHEWASSIRSLLLGATKCYYILTNGYYYEVHVTGSDRSLKALHAPTISEILDWERGQN